MTTTQEQHQKVQRENQASQTLTEYVAQKETQKDLVGKTGIATVTDVQTEFENDDSMLAEFEIRLPDNSTGYLRFSTYRDELLKQFLEEELHTTHAEMNVLMKTFIVVRTEYEWKAILGDAPLRYTYDTNHSSKLTEVDDIGLARLTKPIEYSLLILSALPVIQFGIPWLFFTATFWIMFSLFIYTLVSVMLSPPTKDISGE